MKYYFLGLGTLMAVCVGCYMPAGDQIVDKNQYNAPPAAMLQHPGPMVDGPGPGVMPMLYSAPARTFSTKTTQIRFVDPNGMKIGWRIRDGFAEDQLTVPAARYNFTQGATYRLKLTNIQNHPEIPALYPSLQVYPSHPTTDSYLAHNSIPISLTDEDLNQVESNNFVTKVIYLPDPKNQELAIAGVETIVSTRLDPGVDPIGEAERRGTVMVVLRVGNMDLEMEGHDPDMAGLTEGGLRQVVHLQGQNGEYAPPMPIAMSDSGINGVPSAMISGTTSIPGQPAVNPIAGVGPTPHWGMPITGTPIGLPGPPHLPLGGPAGLRSHTIRNLTNYDMPGPMEHQLIDVKHKPGYRLPKPAAHVQYEEVHPNYAPGEVSYPAWAVPQGYQP